MTRTDVAIMTLPSAPSKNIIWLVYNDDMINQVENRIVELRGQDFLDNYVEVKSISHTIGGKSGNIIYYDPHLYDLIGNGAN